MKYFTPEWWFDEVEDMAGPVEAYRRYIDSIRSDLTVGLVSLLDLVSLHDSRLRDLVVDGPGRSMKLVLDGLVDPWSPSGTDPRRFTLTYQGLRSFQVKSCEEERQMRRDVGYDEIERLDDGTFEHRMLFASGDEFVVRFLDLQLEYT